MSLEISLDGKDYMIQGHTMGSVSVFQGVQKGALQAMYGVQADFAHLTSNSLMHPQLHLQGLLV